MSGAAITVDNLTVRYGEFCAVDNVGFEIPGGQIVALLGPNGAGKTTMLQVLAGLLAPSGGSVRVLGADPRHAPREWRAQVGIVAQATGFDPQLTPREMLDAFAAVFPDPRPAAEVLRMVGLDHVAEVRLGTLSGGQQRRLDVALGIIGRPRLLFLDEPTTGFDPAARRQMWHATRVLAEEGTTVLLTTHYLDEANSFAQRVIVLSAGHIVTDSTPEQIRVAAGGSVVRYQLPRWVRDCDLPESLRQLLDTEQRAIVARTGDVGPVLDEILRWARATGAHLAGLEVGSPSLEDAYLALTAGKEPFAAVAHV